MNFMTFGGLNRHPQMFIIKLGNFFLVHVYPVIGEAITKMVASLMIPL